MAAQTFASVQVRWPGPLDIPRSLEVFRRSGDDAIDRWDGSVLVRTTVLEKRVVPYVCRVIGSIDEPALEVTVQKSEHLGSVERVVRGMFVTAPGALAVLLTTDAVIAQLEARYRGVRPVLQDDLFTALLRSISAQQVNLKWAATTRRRLAETYGRRVRLGVHEVMRLQAASLATLSPSDLRALQFTTRKAEYMISLARAVAHGDLDLEALREASDQEVISRLTAIRGLGRWTAEWFLARALGRPCVAAGDLGVRKAIGAVYLEGRMPSEAEVREVTRHWKEAAGVAQQLILHALSDGIMTSAKSPLTGR